MHKKITIAFLFCIMCQEAYCQTWQWAKGAQGSGTAEGLSVATDNAGNVFITGYFSSPTISFGTYTLTNSGTNSGDIFIAKYDSLGNVLWAKSGGGSGPDFSSFVSTDGAGNAFITGYYDSPAMTLGSFTLTNGTGNNAFIAKYSALGVIQWARTSGGNGTLEGRGIATDGAGNSYITGDFSSSALTFGTHTLSSGSNLDIYLAKYDALGNALWARSAQGSGSDWGNAVAVDASSSLYLTGRYNSPSLTFGTYTVTNSGSEKSFLCKYDSAGSVLWAKNAGSGNNDQGNALATDAFGNIYLTGGFLSALTIGSNTLNNTGNYDVYLAKYTNAGTPLWARSGVGIGSDIGYGVAADSLKNVYVAGRFSYSTSNSISFGSLTELCPAGATDPMFVVKYDSTGKPQCMMGLGSGGDDNYGIATDKRGNVFVVGDFMMSPFVVGTTTLTLSGTEDVFAARADFHCPQSAIQEFAVSEKMMISPNPFSVETTLQSEHGLWNSVLIIYNAFGEVVKTVRVIEQEYILHRNQLQSGLYFVQLIRNDKMTVSGKLLVTD